MKGPFKAMTFFNNSPGQLSTSLLHSDILLTAGNKMKVWQQRKKKCGTFGSVDRVSIRRWIDCYRKETLQIISPQLNYAQVDSAKLNAHSTPHDIDYYECINLINETFCVEIMIIKSTWQELYKYRAPCAICRKIGSVQVWLLDYAQFWKASIQWVDKSYQLRRKQASLLQFFVGHRTSRQYMTWNKAFKEDKKPRCPSPYDFCFKHVPSRLVVVNECYTMR